MRALPSPLPVLQTPRLVLRALVDTDALALFAIFADPGTMQYWSTPRWTDPARAHQTIAGDRAQLASGDALRFGLFARDGDGLIGCAGLHHVDHGNRRAEVGDILRRSAWGHGLMHEAMGVVVDLAFGALRLHRLEADLDPRNTGSTAWSSASASRARACSSSVGGWATRSATR